MKKKLSKGQKILLGILLALVLLIGGTITAVMALRASGERAMTRHEEIEEADLPEEAEAQVDGVISYKQKKYIRNDNVIAILCMGIDRDDLDTEGNVTGINGQADSIFVVALDSADGSTKMLNISRDTMIDVDLYDEDDQYVRTEKKQICLAYAYGDGRESSCENMKKSVSRLLYGMPIDAYAAIDLPAIRVLNDAVGGVEVEVLEDLSQSDSQLTLGNKVVLNGKQAEIYVRSRDSDQLDSNNARMARQKQYLIGFIKKALEAAKSDLTLPLSMYKTVSANMVTDIGVSEVTYLASLVLQGGFQPEDMVSVPGEVTLVDGYAQYHVDETALYEIILDVFYKEVVAQN